MGLLQPARAILAPVDFSDGSRAAFTLAVRLARHLGSRLHVLSVVDPMMAATARKRGSDLVAEARDELQRFIEACPEAVALTPCRDVVIGSAADAIVTIAEREQADLIVLSAHGWFRPGSRPLGSVTQQVLLRAEGSVLVVPDGWTAPDDRQDTGLGPIVVGVDYSESAAVAVRTASALGRPDSIPWAGPHRLR